MIKIDQCHHENIYLKSTAPQGYTIGVCVDCAEFVVTTPIRATITELLDYNWQITNIADRIGVDRH